MKITVPPGMKITILRDPDYTITVELQTLNKQTKKPTKVRTKTSIHGSVTQEELKSHIVNEVYNLWNHELAEWFTVDDVYVFEPH